MSEPFLGEIRLAGFNFAPKGWALCNGQLLPISQNMALYTILGTTYGGDGATTFALPDLRGRVPIHFGGGRNLGERSGEEGHTLSIAEMPLHFHQLNGSSTPANSAIPSGKVPARGASNFYGQFGTPTPMGAGSVRPAGGSQTHENMAPFLTLSFIIALQGLFPSRN